MTLKKTLLASVIGAVFAGTTLLPMAASAETLRIGYAADPETLDIHEQLSGGMLRFSHLAFDPLVRWTKDFEFEPRLATEWEQVDETTMRMTLREGVTFHSGNEFTAEDVVWTIERLKESPDYRAIFEPVASAEAVDDYTVEIVTSEPYPLLLNLATYIFPMDSKFYSGETDEGSDKAEIVKAGNSYASRNVSGTGPFIVTDRRQGVRVDFKRFEDYWDTESEGNVTDIVLTPIAENASRVAALLSGGVDFIDAVPPNDLDRVSEADGVNLIEIDGTRIIGFQMNEDRVEAFQDARVRQAVDLAINQEAIADRLMRGFANPAGQFSPEGYSGHNPDLTPRYDIERAKELMAEAGRQSDMAMIGWHADTEDTANFFQYLTFCFDEETGAGQYNYGGYCNEEIDALVTEADSETDLEKRNEMLREAEAMLYEDTGFIMLHWQNLAYAAADGVEAEPIVNAIDFPYLGDLVINRSDD